MPTEIYIPVILFLGSLVYATFGFGDAIFAMPFLTLLVSTKIATPIMTLNGLTLATLMLIKHHKNINWNITKKLVLAAIFGIPIGIYFLKYGNENLIKTFLYVFIILVALFNLFFTKYKVNLNEKFAYLFGFIGGILGGAFNTAGPPIVIFGILKNWTTLQFIGNLQGYFIISDIFIIVGQIISGILNKTVLYYFVISLPFTLIAFLVGNKIRQKISEEHYKKYIYLLLILVGVYGLIRIYFITNNFK